MCEKPETGTRACIGEDIAEYLGALTEPNFRQRRAGLFSVLFQPLLRALGKKKVTKQAAKTVAKKAAKKAVIGALKAGAS